MGRGAHHALVMALMLGGWASRNKYSILGALRAVAQMVSYEIPLVLSAVTVVMVVGSLNTNDIVPHVSTVTEAFA